MSFFFGAGIIGLGYFIYENKNTLGYKLLKTYTYLQEQYNNYVGTIYKEVCEAPIKPSPIVASSPAGPDTLGIDYEETDIYTYYKDMIFSIFDKD